MTQAVRESSVSPTAAILLLSLAGLANSSSAQTTPIFRMDCGVDAANWPECGFDVADTNATQYYRRSRVAAGSPSGSDAVQFDFTPTRATNLDFGYGWALTRASALPPVPQGAARYIRWRLKINSPVNWRTASDSRWASKIVILGNNCEHSPHQPTRVIQMLRGPGGSVWKRAILNSSQNIDTEGISDAGPLDPVPVDRWVNIQLKVQSSSTPTTPDGRISLYVDNNNEGSPTMQSRRGFVLKTSGWSPATCSDSWLAFGSSAREVMAGANLSFQVADFEYDDEFDPRWHIREHARSTPVPKPTPSPAAVAVAVVPGASMSPAFRISRAGIRSDTVVAFVPVDSRCDSGLPRPRLPTLPGVECRLVEHAAHAQGSGDPSIIRLESAWSPDPRPWGTRAYD